MAIPVEEIETGALVQKLLIHNLEPYGVTVERISNYNSSWDIPKDDKTYFVISIDQNPPYSNRSKFVTEVIDGVEHYIEEQSMAVLEEVTVSVISKSPEARQLTPKVMLAFMSVYGTQLQEKYGLHISRPESRDNSELEATARLNRFDVKVKIFRGYVNRIEVDYFDKFSLGEIKTQP